MWRTASAGSVAPARAADAYTTTRPAASRPMGKKQCRPGSRSHSGQSSGGASADARHKSVSSSAARAADSCAPRAMA